MLVVVCAPLANKAGEGGSAWIVLSWLAGLQSLGLDVHLVEQLGPTQWLDAQAIPSTFAESVGRRYFREVVQEAGFGQQATLVAGDGPQTDGLTLPELHDLLGDAALVLNVSGHLRNRALLAACRRRAYVDLDPGFTQLWHMQGDLGSTLLEHDVLFTVGQNIGTPHSPVPTGGLIWHPIRQPVDLSAWPLVSDGAPSSALEAVFSTVARWRPPYGPIESGGVVHGTRPRLFRRFLDLPHRVKARFELALAIDPADSRDREALGGAGWCMVDPGEVAATPATFQMYVQGSGVELVIPQEAYASLNTGWVGDRSPRYLASGRPVLMFDTGLAPSLPTGAGLVTFMTFNEAVAGAERILAEYPAHAQAARQLVNRYFEARRTVSDLLTVAGVGG